MDILRLSHEREPAIKGKWHFVIDETFAAGVAARGVYPQHKSLPPDWIQNEHKLKIRLPHEIHESRPKKQVRNCVTTFHHYNRAIPFVSHLYHSTLYKFFMLHKSPKNHTCLKALIKLMTMLFVIHFTLIPLSNAKSALMYVY